jgi:Ca2+-binding RTX toxin-like protein
MVAGAVAALGLMVTRGGSQERVKPVAFANGILSTSTSGDGEAILTARALAPGHSASGQVRIHNDSSSDGHVDLSQRLRSETPGVGGGRLFDDLRLTIQQTDGRADGLVYSGPMAALGPTALKRFGGDESRNYSFVVAMPDNGNPGGPTSGDNAHQNASVSVDYIWSANSLDPADSVDSVGGHRCRYGVLGTVGANVLSPHQTGVRVLGQAGDDRISGSRAADCIYGGPGDDVLRGRAGKDLMRGGYGNDVLRGGTGNDRLRGRQGNDVVIGGPGRDRLRGTAGNDLIKAADGVPDRIRCGIGHDTAIADPLDLVSGCERVIVR